MTKQKLMKDRVDGMVRGVLVLDQRIPSPNNQGRDDKNCPNRDEPQNRNKPSAPSIELSSIRLQISLTDYESRPSDTPQLFPGLQNWLVVKGVEVGGEAALARRIGALLDRGLEDGLEEAGVFTKRSAIAGSEGSLDGLFGGGSDEFKAADEDSSDLSWNRRDGEGKNGIHEVAGNNIEEARAFLKPRGFPGFEHGMSLVCVQAMGD